MHVRGQSLWVTLVTGVLANSLSCNSPLQIRRDAGADLAAAAHPDGQSRPDVALDVASEVSLAEVAMDRSSTPDQTGPQITATGFRIINNRDQTYYFNVTADIHCSKEQPPGDKRCYFFHDWALYDCAAVPSDGDCCVFPEQPIPSVLPIPAGESRFIPWPGTIYGRAAGTCAQCECQQPLPEQEGGYVASIQVSSAYTCWEMTGCQTAADGTITGAVLEGFTSVLSASFINPGTAIEVAFYIGWSSQPDAGGADLGAADGPAPDRVTSGLGSDAALADFPEIPGNTFGIAASATPPDAGVRGDTCRPSDKNATYALQFSADGQRVHIVRTDPVAEAMMDGILRKAAGGSLVYAIDNGWAGAELIVRREGTTLAAQLVVFGSGVPVVWCIDAPMTSPASG